jgi:hypothetical protein
LARYNAAGELSCAICNTHIAESALWEPHLRSSEHADAIARLREAKTRKQEQGEVAPSHKRRVVEDVGGVAVAIDSNQHTGGLAEPMVMVPVDAGGIVDLDAEMARFQDAIVAQG